MYNYILKISMAEKNYPMTDEFIKTFIDACNDSNETINSIRNGRKFTYLSRIGNDNMSIKILLESQTSVMPTRAISSITRALLRSPLEKELRAHEYKGCIITSTVIEESEISFQNMNDAEIVQSIIEIFFGQLTSNKEKNNARDASQKIREIVIQYKQNCKP